MSKIINTISTTTSTGTNPIDNITITGGWPYTISDSTITSPYYVNDLNNITFGQTNVSTPLHVQGDAEFTGDIKIKGKSLNKSLEMIEEKLAILHPNKELEDKWNELRELRNKYIQLEQEIIEKEKVWDILQK